MVKWRKVEKLIFNVFGIRFRESICDNANGQAKCAGRTCISCIGNEARIDRIRENLYESYEIRRVENKSW